MNEKASCITINCGCCENNDDSAPAPVTRDSTPIGAIVSYMGTKAPKHYLVCDGAVLNITDYPALSGQIKDEFGSFNYFGGDGMATFSVPDLRNEFLRGYHGGAEDQLSGDIGKHQAATEHINFYAMSNGSSLRFYSKIDTTARNRDKVIESSTDGKLLNASNYTAGTSGQFYASRPTNMAVLYCIKYE